MSIDLDPSAEIQPKDITFLWVAGYYSGVLCGFATWKGKLCYFSACDDSADLWKYTLHSLSEAEAEKAIQENQEFKARSGDHCDMLPDGSNAGGTSKPWKLQEASAAGDAIAAAMEADTWKSPVRYYENPILGWFTPATYLNT